jgi:hypothetical protein
MRPGAMVLGVNVAGKHSPPSAQLEEPSPITHAAARVEPMQVLPEEASGPEVLAQRLPVMRAPAFAQVPPVLLFDSGLIEDDPGSSCAFRQLELHQRVVTGRPGRLAPRLHNPSIGDKFDIAAFNLTAEQFERSTRLALDLGRRHGKRAEFLRVEKGRVDAGGGCFEIDLLMNHHSGRVAGRAFPSISRPLTPARKSSARTSPASISKTWRTPAR